MSAFPRKADIACRLHVRRTIAASWAGDGHLPSFGWRRGVASDRKKANAAASVAHVRHRSLCWCNMKTATMLL